MSVKKHRPKRSEVEDALDMLGISREKPMPSKHKYSHMRLPSAICQQLGEPLRLNTIAALQSWLELRAIVQGLSAEEWRRLEGVGELREVLEEIAKS
jgi:hypothetical protein